MAPWDALPPEAEAGLMEGEPPAIDIPPEDEFMPTAAAMSPSLAEAASAPAVAAPAERKVSIELPPPGSDPLSDRWAELVAQMNAQGVITALVRELAMQAQCVAQRDEGGQSMWSLRVERESLRSETNRERLAQAMSQVLAAQVMLELERGTAFNTPAQRDQVAREQRQHQAEHLIESDALVRSLLAQYPGARIVPGSIKPL